MTDSAQAQVTLRGRPVAQAAAARGACRGEDLELFFPVAASGPALAQSRSAKAACARCPVQANCLSTRIQPGTALRYKR